MEHRDVPARKKRGPRPPDHHRPRVRVVLGPLGRLAQLHDHPRVERIHYLRAVQEDGGHTILHGILNGIAHADVLGHPKDERGTWKDDTRSAEANTWSAFILPPSAFRLPPSAFILPLGI